MSSSWSVYFSGILLTPSNIHWKFLVLLWSLLNNSCLLCSIICCCMDTLPTTALHSIVQMVQQLSTGTLDDGSSVLQKSRWAFRRQLEVWAVYLTGPATFYLSKSNDKPVKAFFWEICFAELCGRLFLFKIGTGKPIIPNPKRKQFKVRWLLPP